VAVAGQSAIGASVTVNGARVAVATNGSFSAVVALVEGPNVITVVARDTSGAEATTVLHLSYAPPPSIRSEEVQAQTAAADRAAREVQAAANQTVEQAAANDSAATTARAHSTSLEQESGRVLASAGDANTHALAYVGVAGAAAAAGIVIFAWGRRRGMGP
jgi:hypothetical protein